MSKPLMSKRRTAIISSVLVALGPVSMSLYTPAMPQLVDAFQTTPAVIKATLTAYFAGFAFFQLAAGPVADSFGRRLSTLVFIAYLVEFLTVREAATSVFFILMCVTLVDVIAGFSITITGARRDFGVSNGDHLR